MMRSKIIIMSIILSLSLSVAVTAAEVPREAVPFYADVECVLIAENLIADILDDVKCGLSYADAQSKVNARIFKAVISNQTNGYGYGVLKDIARNAIFQYRDMVDDLIDKIVVHEKTGTGENRCQQVDIYFNFIGKFDLEYTDEEIAEQKQLAEQAAKEKHERKLERVRLYDKRKRELKRAERLAENDGHLFAKKICEHCGQEYYPHNAIQKFCCKDCCTNATNDRRRKKRYAEKGNHTFKQKNCKLCGKPFWPVNGQEVLCSPECKAQNRRTKQLEYYHTHKKLKSWEETK